MVARVASFEGLNAQETERAMAEAEGIIRPILGGLAGYQGHLELASSGGKVLSITLFDSDANAQAAEATFDVEIPGKLGDLFKGWEGRRVSVDRYNVLADHRTR
ncbi:MAG: hypothetical protein QOF43_1431 [Gaiellaceae bacterium]|nr:hypothetical protein [Gaiellaceae bacterium]